jgi:hypothetical protein
MGFSEVMSGVALTDVAGSTPHRAGLALTGCVAPLPCPVCLTPAGHPLLPPAD